MIYVCVICAWLFRRIISWNDDPLPCIHAYSRQRLIRSFKSTCAGFGKTNVYLSWAQLPRSQRNVGSYHLWLEAGVAQWVQSLFKVASKFQKFFSYLKSLWKFKNTFIELMTSNYQSWISESWFRFPKICHLLWSAQYGFLFEN